ncbi:MAG: hypothetical protein AAB654_05755, partial [Acidobacteriota bacterium]
MATHVWVYWGPTDGLTTNGNWANVNYFGQRAAGLLSTNIAGLNSGTAYYYRYFASNSQGTAWAAPSTNFTTQAAATAPAVNNGGGASNVTSSSAYLRGNLTSTGGASTTVRIYWGPGDGGADKAAWANVVNMGVLGTGAFSSQVTGLAAGAGYYYRCYATNSAGESWAAASANFTTPVPPPGIAWVGSSESAETSSGTATVGVPGGVQNDDTLIAYASCKGNHTLTAPGGWTQIFNAPESGGGLSHAAWRKTANSESGNYSFGGAGGDGILAAVHAFRGVDTATPVDASAQTSGQSGGADAPQVTTTDNGCEILALGAVSKKNAQDGNFWGPPAGYTEREDSEHDSQDISQTMAHRKRDAAGPENPGAFTQDAQDKWCAGTIALRPGAPPTISNDGGASNVTSVSAYPRGDLTSIGSAAATVYVYWGPTDGGAVKSAWSNAVNMGVLPAGPFSCLASGLQPGSLYYYRCYASNSAAEAWAAASTNFSTLPGVPDRKVLGINFYTGTNTLGSNDMAGVVPENNWNNAQSAWDGASHDFAGPVLDGDGADTGIGISHYATYGGNTYENAIGGRAPNRRMMAGEGPRSIQIGGDRYAQIRLSGLTNVFVGAYDVYVYIGNGYHDPGDDFMGGWGEILAGGAETYTPSQADDAPASTNASAPYRTLQSLRTGNNDVPVYSGSFILAGSTNAGNYVKLSGLTTNILVITPKYADGGYDFETISVLGVQVVGYGPVAPDGAGMPDAWENAHSLNTATNDAALDPDSDGLANLREYYDNTDPQNADTDGDGLSDGAEVLVHLSDPLRADTDGDGMPDKWETDHNLNPEVDDAPEDADNDELTNLAEYQQGTDAQNPDTDGDGVSDGAEVTAYSDPLAVDFDGTTNVVCVLNGSQTNSATGSWVPVGGEIWSKSVRGRLVYVMQTTTGDVYELEIEASQRWSRFDKCVSQDLAPVDTSAVELYVDGAYAGRKTITGLDQYKKITFFTPYLAAGSHTFALSWDNVYEPLSLRVRRL